MNKRKKNILERRRQKERIRKEKKITPERKDEDDEQTKDITMISYKITYRFGMPYWEKKKKIAINVICQLVRKFRLMRREECTSELFLYNLPKRIYIYICVYVYIVNVANAQLEFYQVSSNNFLFQHYVFT